MSRLTKAFRSLRSPHRSSPDKIDYAAGIIRSIEGKNIDALRFKYPESRWHKYLELSVYVPTSINICRQLDLIGTSRQHILDIGCGTGLFLYCARHFGHCGVGTDIENGMMAEMASILDIERHIDRVDPFTPISTTGQFDLVTCMGTQFNQADSDKSWGCSEWLYFLKDIESRLSPNGRIFLRINRGTKARALGHMYYDKELHDALSHGHLHGIAYLFDRYNLTLALDNLRRSR